VSDARREARSITSQVQQESRADRTQRAVFVRQSGRSLGPAVRRHHLQRRSVFEAIRTRPFEPMLRRSRRYLCAVIPHDVPAVLHAAGTHARVPRSVQGGRAACRLEGYQTVVVDEVSGASESLQIPTCTMRRYESWRRVTDCFQDHRWTHRLDVALSR
jgi:hypothetical protein